MPDSQPRVAASVVLLRAGERSAEVFMLRRHRRASFMASAFVFPGGAADPGEDDLRLTAARELFEEAGVLLCREEVAPETHAALRAACEGGADFRGAIADAGLSLALDALVPFAHWITPSVEPKRFSAHFFAAALPPGQVPRFDDRETVDQAWVAPADGAARSGDLRLPPPQLRTLWELAGPAAEGLDATLAAAAARAPHVAPLLPRALPQPAGFSLLLPWDPDYERGTGDGLPLPAGCPLAVGPSRFVYEDDQWKHVSAPSSAPPA